MLDFMSEAHIFNMTGHAAVGCGSAVASGGSCGAGALSAGAGSFASPLMAGWNFRAKLVATSVIGGVASVAGGGKFGNGALTAAFGYLFNEFGSSAQRGYDPTYYTGGTVVCNGPQGGCVLVANIQNTWIIEQTVATLFGVGLVMRAGWAAFTGAGTSRLRCLVNRRAKGDHWARDEQAFSPVVGNPRRGRRLDTC